MLGTTWKSRGHKRSQHVSLWFPLVKLEESMWFPPKENILHSVFRKEISGKQRHGNLRFPKGIMRETTWKPHGTLKFPKRNIKGTSIGEEKHLSTVLINMKTCALPFCDCFHFSDTCRRSYSTGRQHHSGLQHSVCLPRRKQVLQKSHKHDL